MDIVSILKSAAAEVEEAGLSADLKAIAFGKILDIRLAGTRGDSASPDRDARPAQPTGSTGPLLAIAQKLRLPPETLEDVYHEDAESLGISVGVGRLDASMSRATKQLALLVAAGRQAGGYDDDWTQLAVIRDTCRDYGKLDSANFASAITQMSNVFSFRGKGPDREVHVTRPGWEEARALIERVAS